jgi:hypothetical protein
VHTPHGSASACPASVNHASRPTAPSAALPPPSAQIWILSPSSAPPPPRVRDPVPPLPRQALQSLLTFLPPLPARSVWRLDGESDLPRPPLPAPLWSPWSSPPGPPATAPPVADRQAPHWALLPNTAVRGSPYTTMDLPPGHRPRISLHILALKQSRREFAACVEVVAAVAQIVLCFTPSSPLPSAPFRSQISASPRLTSVLLSSRADASRRRRTGSGGSPGPSAARRPRERMRRPTGRPAHRYFLPSPSLFGPYGGLTANRIFLGLLSLHPSGRHGAHCRTCGRRGHVAVVCLLHYGAWEGEEVLQSKRQLSRFHHDPI